MCLHARDPVHTANLVANSGNTAYGIERIPEIKNLAECKRPESSALMK